MTRLHHFLIVVLACSCTTALAQTSATQSPGSNPTGTGYAAPGDATDGIGTACRVPLTRP